MLLLNIEMPSVDFSIPIAITAQCGRTNLFEVMAHRIPSMRTPIKKTAKRIRSTWCHDELVRGVERRTKKGVDNAGFVPSSLIISLDLPRCRQGVWDYSNSPWRGSGLERE